MPAGMEKALPMRTMAPRLLLRRMVRWRRGNTKRIATITGLFTISHWCLRRICLIEQLPFQERIHYHDPYRQ